MQTPCRVVPALLVSLSLAFAGQLAAQRAHPAAPTLNRRGPTALVSPARPVSLPPADDAIRRPALLGAVVGGAAGLALGFRFRCTGPDEGPPCGFTGAGVGIGTGSVAGSALGAWAGGGAARCGVGAGAGRAMGGAVLGAIPWVTYHVLLGRRDRVPALGFVVVGMTPFLAAEGATRAVSSC